MLKKRLSTVYVAHEYFAVFPLGVSQVSSNIQPISEIKITSKLLLKSLLIFFFKTCSTYITCQAKFDNFFMLSLYFHKYLQLFCNFIYAFKFLKVILQQIFHFIGAFFKRCQKEKTFGDFVFFLLMHAQHIRCFPCFP